MTTLTELAAMLDAATGPSRELDDIIALSLDGYVVRKIGGLPHFTTPEEIIFAPPGKPAGIPSYTYYIDAAEALRQRLLPGWRIAVTQRKECYDVEVYDCETGNGFGNHPTECIARLRATVAALIAKEKNDEA